MGLWAWGEKIFFRRSANFFFAIARNCFFLTDSSFCLVKKLRLGAERVIYLWVVENSSWP